MAEVWRRPDSIPFPKVWKKFKGRTKINGKIPEFRIQDIPEDKYEEVIAIMTENFFSSEAVESELLRDEASVVTAHEIWRKALKQRLSLVCFTEDENGYDKIASISMQFRRSRSDPKPTSKSFRTIWSLSNHVYHRKNFYGLFNIREMITGIGGFTLKQYVQEKVSLEVLKCRRLLCRATGIRMSFLLVCSDRSLIAAEGAGFTEYSVIPFAELAEADQHAYLPDIQQYVENIKLMYASYEDYDLT